MFSETATIVFVVVAAIIGLAFTAYATVVTRRVRPLLHIPPEDESIILQDGKTNLLAAQILSDEERDECQKSVTEIASWIEEGASAFLKAEYAYMGVFIVGFSIILILFLGLATDRHDPWTAAIWTTVAFIVGSCTSIVSGYIGMKVAVYANIRTVVMAHNAAPKDYGPAFTTAFQAASVMGFALCTLAMGLLLILVLFVKLSYNMEDAEEVAVMYEAIAGYGLGGSSIALFGRVGGGIYTKAADVGADLFKIEAGLDEDSPRNPAVIADNVGDNVGDVAGMGADLFGSFAESSCAAMVISADSPTLHGNFGAMSFPMILAGAGIVCCAITSFFATHVCKVKTRTDVEPVLKRQLTISTVLVTAALIPLCLYIFPDTFIISTVSNCKNWYIIIAVGCGLWSGLAIGFITEYYTSSSYAPVREISTASETGAATNIIYGLALGYKSVIIPVFCLAVTIYVGYTLAGMYGVACGALGILSTLAIGLTIDAYGPICDNAGGLAEMSEMPKTVRDKTDTLDAAGNTTAAIGKGFAIGSAALVSLALFGAYVTTTGLDKGKGVDILQPFEFAGLLVGAMLPYWFSSMTMKSVGEAAHSMIVEVRKQFQELDLLNPHSKEKPNYRACVHISTVASLREMIPPGALVMLTPLLVGFLLGVDCLAGMLAGDLVSGVQMAISASNTGGAWDNAKKYVESGGLGANKGKGSEVHKATVIGDTVGDPLKDTSGPALNILVKLSAITSLVFAPAFPSVEKGGYLVQLFNKF